MTIFKTFKVIAFLEGISYLLLLGIGTPLKYFTGNDILVKSLGMPHGLLFIAYVVLAIFLKFTHKKASEWTHKDLGIILVCSLLPFGTFYVDKKYLNDKSN